MSAFPPDVIATLDRLNAHARAVAPRLWGTEWRAIYTYKTFAAWRAIDAGAAQVRLIRWHGKCGRCTDGLFQDWDCDGPGAKVICRYCHGTAKITPHFTETTLAGACWHHPWEGRVTPGFDLARHAHGPDFISAQGAQWHAAGDWQPRAPGAALTLAALVPLLNQVEGFIETQAARPRGEPGWWIDEAAFRALHLTSHSYVRGPPSSPYCLDLGRAPGGCFLCGREDDLETYSYGRLSRLFHWSLPICKAHRKAPHPDGVPPEAMITPAIAAWQARHERVVEIA